MYLARFSYDVLPVNRRRALDFIRLEVEAARGNGLNARLLVPLTRGHGDGAAEPGRIAGDPPGSPDVYPGDSRSTEGHE